MQNFIYLFYFLFANSILHVEMSQRTVPGKLSVGLEWFGRFFSLTQIFQGGGFSMLEFSVAGIPLCKNLHAGLDFWHD